jgi:hypothetical protein
MNHEFSQEIINHNDTERILHEADLIRGGATMEEGRLVVTASQMEELAREHKDNTLTHIGVNGDNQSSQGVNNPESTVSNAELSESILNEGTFVAYDSCVESQDSLYALWDGSVTAKFPDRNPFKSRSDAAKFAHSVLDEHAHQFSRELESNLVTKDEIDEVVIIRSFPSKSGRPVLFNELVTKNESRFGQEPLVTIQYHCIGASRQGAATRFDVMGRPSAGETRGLFFVPKSLADKFQEKLKVDPTLIRTMMEYGYKSKLGVSPEEWGRARPPYESWREQRGGMSRMALVMGKEVDTLVF